MDAEQRQAARATWSAGDYDAIVDHIWGAGGDLVERVGVSEGDRVLDVACGTGNAAIPAAVAGGRVTGLDITPELFDAAQRRAAEAGVTLELVEGDAEELPFDDGAFDVVLSTFGCMFAPRHEVAARELARVLRPGGRLGVAAWRPDGTVGDFFRTVAQFAPEPPAGFQPPPLWGTRDHVASLFAGTGVEPSFADAQVEFRFDSLEAALDTYWESFPPIVLLREAVREQGREDELREAVAESFRRSNRASDGSVAYPGEYLVTLGEKRA